MIDLPHVASRVFGTPLMIATRATGIRTVRIANPVGAGRCGYIVHLCPLTFIGHVLDGEGQSLAKSLKSLALPRGLEPLFSP
jgi:hypothetical protein